MSFQEQVQQLTAQVAHREEKLTEMSEMLGNYNVELSEVTSRWAQGVMRVGYRRKSQVISRRERTCDRPH